MAPPDEVPAVDKTDKELLLQYIDSTSKAFEKLTEAMEKLSTQAPVPNDAAIRVTKLEKLYGYFIKHTKLKEYKPYDSVDVRLWFQQFDAAIDSIANAGCGLDLATNPLTPVEFIKLLKTKINYQVESEILQSLRASGKEWNTATIAEVRTVMEQLYMKREPKICSVLKLFSRDRLKKDNLSVSAYYAKWKEGLAPGLVCNTDAEKAKCYDLFMTASFYNGLNDPFLQKEVSNIKEENQTLKSVLDEAIAAESRAIHYKETINRSHALDCASELVSVTPAVARSDYQWSGNSNKQSKGRGKGRGDTSDSKQQNSPSVGSYNKNYQQNSSKQHSSHQPSSQQQSSQQQSSHQYGNNGNSKASTGTKPKVICTYCNKPNHKEVDCWKKKREQSNKANTSAAVFPTVNTKSDNSMVHNKSFYFKKIEVPESTKVPESTSDEMSITDVKMQLDKSWSIESTLLIDVPDTPIINALPPSVPDLFQPIITAAMIVEGRYICNFEIDTDASHTVVSTEVYQKAYLVAENKPERGPQTPMKLADGSKSQKSSFSTHLSLARADNPGNTRTFEVMVLEGPSVILGRTAIKYFWPKIYNDLLAAAGHTHKAASMLQAHPKEVLDDMLSATVIDTNEMCQSTSIASDAPSTVTDIEDINAKLTALLKAGVICKTSDVSQEEGEQQCLEICKKYPSLFDGKLGLFRGVTAKIHLKEGHEKYLKVMRPVRVPHGIEKEHKEKLDAMMVTHIRVDGIKLRCASQLVPVLRKGDKSKLRLCVNYKSTLNDHIEDEPYMFPTCNEQLEKLRGEMYTVLDMSGAFNQIAVDTETGELLTVATPEGYAQPTRLPFGIKTAPKIFQSNMDKLIHGMDGKSPIPNTACIVDDICVTGATAQEHFNNLNELLSRLDSAGLKLNAEKCKFYQKEVKFLGKIVDKDGQRVNPDNVAAILNMPVPKDKQALRSFLGHMSYIGKHISDMRTARAPLDALLKQDEKFIWTKEHTNAFEKCKKMASSTATLAHYDDSLPLVLTTDASPYGLGACLSHKVDEDGKSSLKPLYYASCSLKPSEKNYAQVDREGLAVFWATKYFRQFLQCRSFELQTDCSALKRIFGPKNDLGGCASSRLNRWAAALSGFDFNVVHIKGTSNRVCDSLSRLPSPSAELDSYQCSAMSVYNSVSCLAKLPVDDSSQVCISSILGGPTTDPWNVLPVSVKDVAKATRDDRVYGKLLNAVRTGQANLQDADLKPFISMLDDFHIEQDTLFYGARIIIPTVLQTRLLDELHQTHMGAAKMKETSRKYFWWPKITVHIDNIVKNCLGCAKYKRKPVNNSLCPWPFARAPMERVHIDYCDYKGKQLLVMIDSFTKYIWVKNMNADSTASNTLVTLFEWFGECSGFPKTLVSDNGTQFTSHEFAAHMKVWGIKHLFSPPYHPASNGLAEKAVHIIKDKLKKMDAPAQPLQLKAHIADVLRVYRGTVHSATDETPYELMKKAVPPSLFPQLQIKHKDIVIPDRKRAKVFKNGDRVLVFDKITKLNNFGIVSDIKSKNSYIVNINGIPKHISGDNMSHTVPIDNDNEFVDGNDKDNVSVAESDTDSEIDNISLFSDDDVDQIIDYRSQLAPQQDNVIPAPASPRRLRSGRLYKNRF